MPSFRFQGQSFSAEAGETILDALLRQGIEAPHKCKVGACQSCLLQAVSGETEGGSRGVSEALLRKGYFLSCQAKPGDGLEACLPSDGPIRSVSASIRLVERATEDVLVLSVALDEPLEWLPGQFIRLEIGGVERNYSIASGPGAAEIELHVRLIPGGAMSSHLAGLCAESVPCVVAGPFGDCTYRENEPDRPILLIGSGTGLAPLLGVIRHAISSQHRGKISLYHGAIEACGLYYHEEIGRLASEGSNFSYFACADMPSEESEILCGSPLQHALEAHPDLTGWRVYLCGHPAMARAAQRKTFLAGADLACIHVDAFEAQSC